MPLGNRGQSSFAPISLRVFVDGTDNKALSKIGIIGYGFSPLKLDPDLDFMALFHGVDERVPVDGLRFGVNVLKDFLETA